MGRIESPAYLLEYPEPFVNRQRTIELDHVFQVVTFQVLNRNVNDLAPLPDVMHSHDIGMSYLPGKLCLLQEPLENPVLCRILRVQNLEGNYFVKPLVL